MKKLIVLSATLILLAGCATTLHWPVPMPDGSVEWAKYKTPKFGRDSDFHFVLTTPNGISLEIEKIDRSNAEAIAEKVIEGALRAALAAAKAGATGGAGTGGE